MSRSNNPVTSDPDSWPKRSTEATINGRISKSRRDVILVIVGAILLVIVLIVVVVLVSYCVRRQMLFSAYRLKIKKNKYEYSIPSLMMYASAYSLPIQSYVKYHDPSTYEDISVALQDFTNEVDPSWISMDVLINEGEFYDMYCGTMKTVADEEKVVAVKILKANASQREKNYFLVEATTVGQFVHEHVLRLLGVVSLSEPHLIVTDHMINGSLLDFLMTNKDNMTVIQQLNMLSNIASGMRYLSARGFVHRDLAARNILVDADRSCKIADFGLAREFSSEDEDEIYQNKNEIKIPIKWTSPEAILFHHFSHAGDVWSYGVVAWEILSYGEKPYWQWSNQEVIDAIQSGYRLPPPVNCPPIIHNLMLHCWNSKPEHRPTFAQLYFEVDRLMSQVHVGIQIADPEYHRELKSSEITHLLRNSNDINQDFIAPQPPPRNVVFNSRIAKIGSTPDTLGFSSTLTREMLGYNTNPYNNEMKMKEPIMSSTNSTVMRLQPSLVPSICQYPPHALHPHHKYRSPYSTSTPQIPPHKIMNTAPMTSPISALSDFLLSIDLVQYLSVLRQYGVHSVDHLRHLTMDNLKSMGIVSKQHRSTIINALRSKVYC